jgi:aromatic-L-amino-acid decarboxylase
MGRNSVVSIPVDSRGAMAVDALRTQLQADADSGCVPVAIVATAGTTDAGVIDPIQAIADLALDAGIWLHVDGAYGLPGMLDARVREQYAGLERADSVTVDPHKWLGAPVGIGATFVRDLDALRATFTQGVAPYLEGSESEDCSHSMASLGIRYSDFGVELSAPPRGAVVWALLSEIGRDGLRERVVRHNDMARAIADRARAHPNLELVMEPTLSICCFRYIDAGVDDLDQLNRNIHRQLMLNNKNIPSTTVVNGKLVLRPCFVGARAGHQQAVDLVDEVLEIGASLSNDQMKAEED